jgi:hypothetical protein
MRRVGLRPIAPLVVVVELLWASQVDISRESLQILQEPVLLSRWVELDKPHIGLKRFVGVPIPEKALGEETEGAGNLVRSSAGKGGSYTLP